jgi:hypothetical protein
VDSPLLPRIGLIVLIFAAAVIVGSVFGPVSTIPFLILVKIVAIMIGGMRAGYRQTMAEKRKREFVAEDGARLEVIDDEHETYWETLDAQQRTVS